MKTAFTFPFCLQLSTCCSQLFFFVVFFFYFLFLHCASLLRALKLRATNAPQTNDRFHDSNGFWRITSTVKCFSVDAARSEVFLNRPPRTWTLAHTHTHTHTHTSGGHLHNEWTDQEGEVQQGGGAGGRGRSGNEQRNYIYTYRFTVSEISSTYIMITCVFICPRKNFFGVWDYNESCV